MRVCWGSVAHPHSTYAKWTNFALLNLGEILCLNVHESPIVLCGTPRLLHVPHLLRAQLRVRSHLPSTWMVDWIGLGHSFTQGEVAGQQILTGQQDRVGFRNCQKRTEC